MLASIKDVFFGYLDKTILENINVTIQEGDRVGLVGPNGEGKTTLLNLVFGDLIPDQARSAEKPDSGPDISVRMLFLRAGSVFCRNERGLFPT